uniref:Reverse transcriptase domain-containing protein n=1 Tax=Trichuris muris TaxID=70415 RepID=A0A5S6Q7T2_TRIMR
MDTVFANLKGVVPYFDDALIMAESTMELLEVLKVFNRLRRIGMRRKCKKCVFGAESVKFLGYRIDACGINPSEDKADAMHMAPQPKNKLELQAFLGLLNFYHNFLANKASVAEPLHRLLDKERAWK